MNTIRAVIAFDGSPIDLLRSFSRCPTDSRKPVPYAGLIINIVGERRVVLNQLNLVWSLRAKLPDWGLGRM